MTWTVDSSGTQSATINTEHILASPTTNATYEFSVDVSALDNGDLLELRVYDKIDGTNYQQIWKGTYQHVQVNGGKVAPAKAITTQGKFTLKQTAGTGRNFPWILRRI